MKKRNLFIVMAVYFWMFLVPFGAFASDAAPENWLVQILLAILAFAGILVTALIPIISLWLIKKYKLDISAKQAEALAALGMQAKNYVEEQAAKAIKNRAGPMKSYEKLDEGVKFFIDGVEKLGLPQKGRDYAVKQIEAALGDGR